MMTHYYTTLLLVVAMAALFSANAFAPASTRCQLSVSSSTMPLAMAVVDIDGEAAFDKTIQNAGNSLVVVDYSTTW
jgi:hypothetical protein